MSHQVDPLFFWLEQEPANSSEDTMVFLPADTPTDNTLNKYNYQLGKKGQVRRHRTLDRLRAYEMEKIAKRRRKPHTRDARSRPLAQLEAIKGSDFLNTHKNELMELFQMTKKYQTGDQIVNTAKYPDSELQLEERDHSHARALQLKNTSMLEENEKEFYRLRSELYKEWKDLGHHPSTASSPTTVPTRPTNSPPHPPKTSSRDPRNFMADPRRSQQ